MGESNQRGHNLLEMGVHLANFVIVKTYVPESNEYVKGIANERELVVSSMGILSVPLNVADHPELPG